MKIALASGLGIEGASLVRYYQAKGDEVVIFDSRPAGTVPVPDGVVTVQSPNAFQQIQGFDLIVRTPGVRPDELPSGIPVWSPTNEFFAQCPAPIIGVTGTKGKGTTSTLIAKMLSAAGRTVHLVGNIGQPALDELAKIEPDDVVVYELSSFQLWDAQRSPHIAVLLMIEEDHLDAHPDMVDYLAAKANITKYQSADDVLIHHPSNPNVLKIVATSPAQPVPYLKAPGAENKDGQLEITGHAICRVEEVGLLGSYNIENICAAITAAWQFTQDVDAIRSAVLAFTGLEHRLQLVAERGGRRFYDDSQATIPESTVADLSTFPGAVAVILGGSDKGIDLSPIVDELSQGQRFAVLIGQTADELEKMMKARQLTNFVNLGRAPMAEIVKTAAEHVPPGGVVLLAPGCASFDMFKNFADRGEQFAQAAQSV